MKIKILKKNNLKSFFRYLNLYYKKNHILSKSKKLFDWQYLSNKNYNFYYLLKKNKIKSIHGIIPTSHFDKNIINNTLFLSVWSSSGIATGAKLLFFLVKKLNFKLIVGLGSSGQSFSFQKLAGFKCGYLNHFFLTSNKSKKKLISPNNFSNYKTIKKKNNYKELKYEEDILKLNSKIFTYQEPKKTSVYLINRYLKHPFYKYNIYLVEKKNKSPSVFIFRLCKYKNSSAIRIVDFIGPNYMFSEGKYLFDFLLKKNSSDFIDIYSFGIPTSYFRNSNLENINKYKKNNLIIPYYFEPYIHKNFEMAFAYKVQKKLFKPIRFFKGDSDMDRPNRL